MQQESEFLFTSDLSINEFLLVQEAGFQPVGMVVGTSIYHIGVQRSNWSKNEEMIVLSEALYHARTLAMRRMTREADELGADGIIGVRLTVKHLEWNSDLAEFVAIGTAVADPELDWRVNGKPFTSDLSGQDFWSLIHAGYRPLSMVMGNCVYHVAHQSAAQALRTMGRNTEMTNFTEALYDARELAMERMQSDAERVGAEGIVGVDVNEGSYGWDEHMIEFFAVGTAIAAAQKGHYLPKPHLVLSLDDNTG